MSKAVKTDHEFNKKRFAELLLTAKGNRTQAQFASECGLSASHLNRYYNMQKEQPLVPSTIVKIAQNAQNDVTVEELLDASGYDPEQNYNQKISLSDITNWFERLALSQLMICLSHCDFKWSNLALEEPLPEISSTWNVDMAIDIEDSPSLDRWVFEIYYLSGKTKEISRIDRLYGRICQIDTQRRTKVSIVVDSEESFDMVKKFPPRALPIYFSVILFDAGEGVIVKEEYLPTALALTEDLTNTYTLEGKN